MIATLLLSTLFVLPFLEHPQAYHLHALHRNNKDTKVVSGRGVDLNVSARNAGENEECRREEFDFLSRRRDVLAFLLAGGGGIASGIVIPPTEISQAATEEEGAGNIFAPKFVQEYSDFLSTDEGWSYRDVKTGDGNSPEFGDRVVFDWSGYTIGYFGRPFEAKGGPQGGAFDKDLDYSRTVLGSGQLVKGLECALKGMKPGGVRQVLVPYGPLSYPRDDLAHDTVGPKPSTFSGQRALNFVLENPRVDRTLLFNVKVVRVDKSDGKGGFVRGNKSAR